MKYLKLMISFLLCILIVGCSNTHKYNLDLRAEKNLNLSQSESPLPVVVKFYELTEINKFEQASFIKLWRNPNSVLGETLVNSSEVTIQPGETQKIELHSIRKDSKYLVACAMFRTPEDKKWYIVTDIKNNSFVKNLKIRLNHNSIELIK